MIYATSDIHGRLDRLKKLIDKIGLSHQDKLYILGDLVDRGEEPIETIEFVMNHPNIKVIMGNHDEMMLKTLRYKDEKQQERWMRNGYEPTLIGFNNRSKDKQDEILNYIESLPYYKIIDGYLLVHAGFEFNRLDEDMKTMSLEGALMSQKDRLVWVRDDFFNNKALDGLITIFGHSPVQYILRDNNPQPPYEIWIDKVHNDKIGVDTGNCYEGGRLACIRLDDEQVFYID